MLLIKKQVVPLGICMILILGCYIFFSSTCIRVGMHKTEVIDILGSYDISAIKSIIAGDTLISILPKKRDINRPNRKYVVIFRDDVLYKFEPYRIKYH